MQDGDKIEFISQVNGLLEVFGKPKLTPAAAQVWWSTIRDQDHNDVFGALGYWAQNNNKPPAPRDIWTQANDARTNRLEARADVERSQNRGNIEYQFRGATEYGMKMLRLIAESFAAPKDMRPMADIVLERIKAGEQVPYVSRRYSADWLTKNGREDDARMVLS